MGLDFKQVLDVKGFEEGLNLHALVGLGLTAVHLVVQLRDFSQDLDDG